MSKGTVWSWPKKVGVVETAAVFLRKRGVCNGASY